MADEDEIDILGDFSFNSCLAQNNQGIPSSENEDTVHPQWLLDSTESNWYDNRHESNTSSGPSRILSGNSRSRKSSHSMNTHTTWNKQERLLLNREMSKYGRDVKKISQTLKTKSEAEIQALIEAEHGVHLDTPHLGLDKAHEEQEDIPAVVQEEIVADDTADLHDIIEMVTTGSPTIVLPSKKNINRSINSLLKPEVLLDIKKVTTSILINPSEIFYDDDLIIGSTESVEILDGDNKGIISKRLVGNKKSDPKLKPKVAQKIGNHRRKHSTHNYDSGGVTKPRNRSKDNKKSPLNRQRKDSNLSEDSKSPKLQIVFSSGQALPVSEGEQVIKIEKKTDSESEGEIDIDVDSDNDSSGPCKSTTEPPLRATKPPDEAPIAVPLSKFEPMPSRRQKKINLDGEGGYTIMHTAGGDLVAVGAEPRQPRKPPRAAPVSLIQCRMYNADRPAPYEVRLYVSTLISMDVQAHGSRAEVMGLLGGEAGAGVVTLRAYRPAAAAAGKTHCDMDPVSQALASEHLLSLGHTPLGWHHSHPAFPPAPSARDLRTQAALQRALERPRVPFLGLITSQHWPTGRTASQYRCIRVETTEDGSEAGFQLSVKLVPDLTVDSLPGFLRELRASVDGDRTEFSVRMAADVCPQAGVTYLEKCISSVSHHLRSAGYSEAHPLTAALLRGLRDVFR
ncbi:uncharacterized protein LOC105395558 [Plutella xylostella]|uniref:uncharacterized protein LOC105395558 n=1 Tax=Plutella xylostella TaxID=51655 RepID=UPI002032579C|nr:uncharacterized protein LOC105395558 [Plutella xylostella]